jgi:hypothetical protein
MCREKVVSLESHGPALGASQPTSPQSNRGLRLRVPRLSGARARRPAGARDLEHIY